MKELLWRLVARVISAKPVADWLIARAQRTPYTHLGDADGSLYMARYWLFNPYPPKTDGDGRRWTWLPSLRIHLIAREDRDRHLHDHPWNARTIVLRGWYIEERDLASVSERDAWRHGLPRWQPGRPHRQDGRIRLIRGRGYTGPLHFGQFHRIDQVPSGGVWTLFITWRKQGTWGFDVDGQKVPWREYLKEENQA